MSLKRKSSVDYSQSNKRLKPISQKELNSFNTNARISIARSSTILERTPRERDIRDVHIRRQMPQEIVDNYDSKLAEYEELLQRREEEGNLGPIPGAKQIAGFKEAERAYLQAAGQAAIKIKQANKEVVKSEFENLWDIAKQDTINRQRPIGEDFYRVANYPISEPEINLRAEARASMNARGLGRPLLKGVDN
jgi:hypothetical protein